MAKLIVYLDRSRRDLHFYGVNSQNGCHILVTIKIFDKKRILLIRDAIFVSFPSSSSQAPPPKYRSQLEVYLFDADSSPSPTWY